MIPEYFAVIGAVIASIGGFYYLYETITGKSKPNRITWLLWGIFPMITFIAQRVQGVSGLSWATFVAGFTPLLVFAASFINKKAFWKTRRIDYFLMLAAIVGIILWAVTDNANLAIFFAIVADFMAAIPTIIKCYQHPETESWIAYGMGAFGFAIGMLTLNDLSFKNYAFITYLTIVNSLMALFAFRKPVKNLLQTEP